LALTEKGEIYAFGNSKDDKLGIIVPANQSTTENIEVPQLVQTDTVFYKKNLTQDLNQLFAQFKDYT
jgi:hypothetical protein